MQKQTKRRLGCTVLGITAGFALLAVIAGNQMIWIVFSALVCFSFPMTADWQTHTGWLWPEFGLLLLAGAMTFRSWSAPSDSEGSS